MLQTADRVLQILARFDADREVMSTAEISEAFGLHRSTASRLTSTLTGRGFLEGSPAALRLGPEVGRLGWLVVGNRLDALSAAWEVMEQLAADCRETVTLSVLDRWEAVSLVQADGPHIIGIGSWTGRRTPSHCTADGKVLMAFDEELELPAEPLVAYTDRTVTDPGELARELAAIREAGWGRAVGEVEDGLHGASAPVRDPSGRCRAAIVVSGPSYRMPPERLEELGERCIQAAERLRAHAPAIGLSGVPRAPVA
ncbi:IclR family transcriptional regulator [Egibacter rhizosphaerae]|nr:IclR family transcriptional regulator [Egibacter rhizosphaerae]